MIKSNAWSEKITRGRDISSRFSFVIVMKVIALLLGGVLGMLIPFIININYIQGRTLEIANLVLSGPVFWGLVIGAIIMTLIIFLRLDELAATILIAIHLYVDWYLGLTVVAQIVAFVLLLIFFLARSPRHPWIAPRALWLWMLFLALAIFPAIRGALSLYDIAFYYPNIICGALLMFWLGIVIARDAEHVERFFKILATVGAFLAIHTIIQAMTGTVLFGSARFDQFIASAADFALASGSSVHRIGSFFVDPNWNGTFFATILFLPIGLFVTSSSFLGKALYFTEALLMLPALLFTYSNGAWIGFLAGIIAFVVFVGRTGHRVLPLLLIAIFAMIAIVYLPLQLNLQLQHLSGPNELLSRIGAWQTGIQVIVAFPLTGVGLGLQAYLQRAEPYRVPAQYIPLAHPHNSYIELGAMAGLPVLAVFLALLSFALWQALHNWALSDGRTRALLSGGIAAIVALSTNSWSINAWTLPPLATVGWLILGVISSPLLIKSINSIAMNKNNSSMSLWR